MDQKDIIGRLAAGEGFGGERPQRIDTHISVIFLTAERAYKLKRAVTTSYLDYGTLDAREEFSRREIAINRRTAPEIYLAAVPVRSTGGEGLVIDDSEDASGDGDIVEWLVMMRRFDPDALLSRLADRQALGTPMAQRLGDVVARFHKDAERIDDHAADERLAFVVDENREELDKNAGGILDAGTVEQIDSQCRVAFERVRGTLRQRGKDGFVRHCHGDMHLRNICLIDSQPVLFDAIEFSDRISHIDVLFDLAFLLMDLIYRRDNAAASAVFNRYLYRTGDTATLDVMPLFIALRAGIRAHTSAMAAQGDPADPAGTDCRGYAAVALSALRERRPALIAVSGLSGTGKSSVARLLAPELGPMPGALVISSDLIRKRRLGVDPLTRLGPDAYNRDIDEAVYGEMTEIAEDAIGRGHAAILDATFIQPQHRAAVESLARESGIAFTGLQLAADARTLESRVRSRTNDPSDATVDILRRQLDATPREDTWRTIDAAQPLQAVARDCRHAIQSS